MVDFIQGLVTSLVTPFASRLGGGGLVETEIDEVVFRSLLRWQASAGVRGVAVGGWVGEGPTLARTERIALVRMARAAAGDRVKVLAHIGSNSTERSILYALDAQMAGADALVLVVPYYSKPSAEGILGHVRRVAHATDLPLILEFDARTGLSVSVAEMARMIQVDGVRGVIDHSANPLHVECLALAHRRLPFLTGCEANAIAAAAFGADGIFSAIANVVPCEAVALWRACEANDFDEARRIHRRLMPLLKIFDEEGVSALKAAMYPQIGLDPVVRLPLVSASSATKTRVAEALRWARSDDDVRHAEAVR